MTEANEAEIKSERSDTEALAKISPAKIDTAPSDDLNDPNEIDITTEKSVIEATRFLLRHYGIRKVAQL